MSSSGPRMVRNRRPKSHVNQGSRPRAAGLASWHLRPHPGRNVAAEQPVGLRLPADFKIPHSQRFEFEYEKAQLLKILEAGWNARTADAWKPHPLLGKMTPKEWSKLLQIHVDYPPEAVRSLTGCSL